MVKLNDIIDNLHAVSTSTHVYYNPEKNIFEFIDELYSENVDDFYDEMFLNAYIELPNSYDINMYALMVDFVDGISDDSLSQKGHLSLRGKGAFKRFKYFIFTHNLDDDWNAYINYRFRKIAIKWCVDNDIPFV